MKALQYRKSIPRYALLKLLGPRIRGLYTSGVAPLSLVDIAEPKLPTPAWVRIAPKLAGICGSDLATICAKGGPYLAPVTSMPFVMGHELVGMVTEAGAKVQRVRVGDRVVLRPALGCTVRGIEPQCDACAAGRDALCRNVTRGVISAGIQTGYCRDTGGAFGESLVAHESQVYKVPEELDDLAAVLIEPFACALHGVLRLGSRAETPSPYPLPQSEGEEMGSPLTLSFPLEWERGGLESALSLGRRDRVLVIGCGSIGLLTIAALRASGCKARILAAARYGHQGTLAKELGADELLDSPRNVGGRFAAWAKSLDAEVLKAEIGKPTVIGGADAVFDCVASSESIDDGIRFTRSGGTIVLVGMPDVPRGVDWTPIWFKELTIRAAYAYGPERCADGVRDTFDLAIEYMGAWGSRLSRLVGGPFELGDYLAAIQSALNAGRTGAVKTVFGF